MSNPNVLVIDGVDCGIELAGISSFRHKITSVPGVAEALDCLEREPADCVIFSEDALAPALSTRNRIRAVTANTPMVMLTNGGQVWNDAAEMAGEVLIRLDKTNLDAALLNEAIADAIRQSNAVEGRVESTSEVSSLVLIIDDNPDDREACIRALRKISEGRYHFVEATDGRAGLEAIVSAMPAIVLLDYSLPGRDGLVILSEIRQHHPFLPVIILTGQGNEGIAVKGIKAGALDYFNKSSLNSDSLHRSMEGAIELGRKAETIDRQNRTITRQRQRLESSNHFLHRLLDHIPDPTFVKDSGGLMILGNRAFRDLIDVPGQVLPKEEVDAFAAQDDHALESGDSETSEQQITGSAGVPRLFSVKRTTFLDSTGSRILVGVMRDITDERRSEDEFKQQSAMLLSQQHDLASLGALLEESSNEILIVDAATLHLVQVNKGGRLNLGYAKHELELMSVLDIKPQFTAQEFRILLETFDDPAQVKTVVHTSHRRKNGTRYDVEVHTQIATFHERKVFVQIVFDETERKRLDKMKSEFISTVSHELRTPLTSIRGALGLINAGACGSLPEMAANMIGIACSNAERLVRLVNDILVLEKSTSGNLPMELRKISVAEFLSQAIDSNSAYGAKHNVRLVLENVPPNVSVEADYGRLMQILANLLSNAAKFSTPESIVRVRAFCSGTKVRFEVEDRGSGIPIEFQPHVFKKFAQADSSPSRRHEGTGLGLCITKQLVEAMNGQIGFESEPGVKTIFFFELPMLVDYSAASRIAGNLGRVLICEDDMDVATIMRIAIEQAGFEVDTAHSILDAKRKLKEETFSALTLDLRFPEGDGFDFLRELRFEVSTQGLPVIVVSALADQDRSQFRGDAGVVDWLSKPIDHFSLVTAVRKSILTLGNVRPVLEVSEQCNSN